jgi:tetratricopeptide (TPR) repeat protein
VSRSSVAAGIVALCVARAAVAAEPTVDDIKAAEADFNRGREAYKASEFVEAAEYFESADGHAPNEKVLELAISARDKAGNADRAATLGQLALETYPNSERLKKVAAPLVDKGRAELLQVTVECNEPCSLLDGARIVHGPPAARRVVFLTPGEHALHAGWSDERGLVQNVNGGAGETASLTFVAPPVPVKETSSDSATGSVMQDRGTEATTRTLPPLYFYIGAGATPRTQTRSTTRDATRSFERTCSSQRPA